MLRLVVAVWKCMQLGRAGVGVLQCEIVVERVLDLDPAKTAFTVELCSYFFYLKKSNRLSKNSLIT